MLSSNFGSEHLLQAALSRSQFLKLAGGALLPLAGYARMTMMTETVSDIFTDFQKSRM